MTLRSYPIVLSHFFILQGPSYNPTTTTSSGKGSCACTMTKSPTFVLVPGAWHGPETWDQVASLLKEKGFKCVAVELPSTLSDPSATFYDDVQAVRRPITEETTQGRDVVVVVHSYGSIVGCSAVKDFTRPKDKDESPPSTEATPATTPSGHVIGITVMASGFVPSGLSFLEALGGKPPPAWREDLESGFAVVTADPREMLYHDLSPDEAEAWTSRLRNQALAALKEGGEHTYAGWLDVPNYFLATVQDKALPVEMQRMAVDMARQLGADVTLREIESSHSPMLSRPVETVAFLLEAATHFQGAVDGSKT